MSSCHLARHATMIPRPPVFRRAMGHGKLTLRTVRESRSNLQREAPELEEDPLQAVRALGRAPLKHFVGHKQHLQRPTETCPQWRKWAAACVHPSLLLVFSFFCCNARGPIKSTTADPACCSTLLSAPVAARRTKTTHQQFAARIAKDPPRP